MRIESEGVDATKVDAAGVDDAGAEAMRTDLLRDAIDMHAHTMPDVASRSMTDIALAQRAMSAGIAGFVSKCHQGDSSARAAVASEAVRLLHPGTDFRVFGGIVLNHPVGGLNAAAVYACGRMGGRIVWFPTVDADNDARYANRHATGPRLGASNRLPVREPGISVLDDEGNLTAQTIAVLECIKEFDMVLATGHLSPHESLVLIRQAAQMGIRRILVTHVSLPITKASISMQRRYVDCGAMVEHCYFTPLHGLCPWRQIAESIRYLGAGHVVLSSDLGQAGAVGPVDGLAAFLERLNAMGISEDDLHRMVAGNPRKLLVSGLEIG